MSEMYDPSGREWPHDPDGEQGSEGGRNYGLAVLSKMVDEEDFPLDRAAFVEEFGEWPVRLNYNKVVSVADIFEHVDVETFDDKVAFHRAAGKAMREHDMWEYQPSA